MGAYWLVGKLTSASRPQMVFSAGRCFFFKRSLIAQVVPSEGWWRIFQGGKETPRIGKWRVIALGGPLRFRLTSHRLSASARFSWVEISLPRPLNHSRLIVPSKVHLSRTRIRGVTAIVRGFFFVFFKSGVGERAVWYGAESAPPFPPWEYHKDLGERQRFFLFFHSCGLVDGS